MTSDPIGKSYPTCVYMVGREKIREYATAVAETNPLYFDLDAARAAGHADLVAPPMFVAVYSHAAVVQALFDPQLSIDFARMVHGAQTFEWDRVVVAGDELSTIATVKEISDRKGLGFYVFETATSDLAGRPVARGTWTNIVRRA